MLFYRLLYSPLTWADQSNASDVCPLRQDKTGLALIRIDCLNGLIEWKSIESSKSENLSEI